PGDDYIESSDWIAVAPYALIIAKVINVSPVESNFNNNEKQLQLTPMSIVTTATDVECAGLTLGSLEVEITGGTAPYIIHWNNGMDGSPIQVPSGTYSVVVTDASGIIDTAFVTVVDLAQPVAWYQDADNDSYGNAAISILACSQPSGYVSNDDDCNDANLNVHPGATEICNGMDDDCDGLTDDADPSITGRSTWYADADGDGFGDAASSTLACNQPSGYVSNDDDCDDANMNVHPGAIEICNGMDDDCDGLTDSADPSITGQSTWYADADGDGFGNASVSTLACNQPSGYVSNDEDCSDANMNVHPGAVEICNSIDDDCDGLTDDADPSSTDQVAWYADTDGDGYGDAATSTFACNQPSGYVSNDDDCNDGNMNIHPNAIEICNGIDDDCDGSTDEEFAYSVLAAIIESSEGNVICLGESTSLSISGGVLGSSGVWRWYEGGCGSGISIGSGTSLVVTPSSGTHFYFVRAEGICNTTSCLTITIMVNTAPSFSSCPIDLTANNTTTLCTAIRNYSTLVTGSPTPVLSYDFSGATTGSGSGIGSGSAFNVGTTMVTLTAENSCGSAECEFDITIHDTEHPVIVGCPAAITNEIEPGQWGAHVSWIPPTATDNCVLSSLTASLSPGSFFNVGSTMISYTAEDASGNTSSCQFLVTILPPVIQEKVNLSIYVNDIAFSNNHPETNSTINVSATVRNTSNVNAGSFSVQLTNLFSNTSPPSVTIPELNAHHSTQVNWILTTPNVAAFVPIRVAIDVLDDLDESNELDNIAVKPFVCGTPTSIGTMAVSTNSIPSTSLAGSTIQLCGSAHYAGVIPLLADSSVAAAEVTIIITETNETFLGYTNDAGNFCLSYNTPNTAGTYHYAVEITDHALSGEASGEFILTEPPPPPCVKDLYVSIELTGIEQTGSVSYTILAGSAYSGTVHVNNGCLDVSQSTSLFISLPGGSPMQGPFTIPALSPGQVYDVALSPMSFASTGNTYISATVDYYNVVMEDNESNNTDIKFIQVRPLLPDMAVISGQVLSDAFCEADNQVTFIVKNYGTLASGTFNAVFQLYENNVLHATQTQILNSLLPQDQTTIIFPFTPAFLVDSFVLKVDVSNMVAEISELNNTYLFSYKFEPCKPDLIVLGCEYAQILPASPVPAQTLTVTTMIRNIGEIAVTTPFVVKFNIAGSVVSVPVSATLAPLEVLEVSAEAPAPVSPGSYATITADGNVQIAEVSEGNNSYSLPLCYDFEFETLNCTGDAFFNGTQFLCDPANLNIGLWNFGAYEAEDLNVKFEISGPGLNGWVDLGLATKYMGQSCDCPDIIEWPGTFYFPQPGNYQVRMTLDPNNVFDECNEANNQMIVELTVAENADYKVLSSYITPSDLNPDINEMVSFNVTYTNDGCTGFSPIELYARMDNDPLDSLQVPALPFGGLNTVAIPHTWSSADPGIHVFRAIIDHDHLINEGDEDNNEAIRTIFVGDAPDFHVMSLTSSDNTPDFGQLLTLSADIQNDGGSSGSGILQFLYKNGSEEEVLIDQQIISPLPGNTITESIIWMAVAPNAKIIARVINVEPIEFDFSDNEKQLQLNNLVVTTSSTDVPCSGLTLGSLTVYISGGQSPYSIHWSNGYMDQIINVPAGTYSVSITDVVGLTAFALDTVMDLALPVTWYQDLDNDGYGNPAVHQLACIQPIGYVGTGTDCNDNFATVYPEAPEIADGKDNDCDGQIDEGITMLNVDAGDCHVSYLGYGNSNCTDLTVNAYGGSTPYTYLWSNGATTQTVNVCPVATTIYNVTVTDHNGYTAKDKVTVQVIDIRCGNNNNKVLVCHLPPGNPQNIQMICIAPSAVPAHLAHGDYLGICSATDPCDGGGQSYQAITVPENLEESNDKSQVLSSIEIAETDKPISLVPNPADAYLSLEIPESKVPYEVTFYDLSGKLMQSQEIPAGNQMISTSALPNGIYFVRLRSADIRITSSIVIMH
ncbi:MAG: CARDB domain-containing protein, partial [Saprospiraceae bacterium]